MPNEPVAMNVECIQPLDSLLHAVRGLHDKELVGQEPTHSREKRMSGR